MSTIRLKPDEIDRIVDPLGLVNDIEEVLKSNASAPLRPSLEEKGSWFSSMLARGLGYYVVKLVGVFPDNPKRGMPLVKGVVLLFDAGTGDLLLEVDAARFTAWRTAAATALALRILRAKDGVLGLIGAGVQGRYHVKLLSRVMNFYRYLIYDVDRSRAETLAKEVGGEVSELEVLLGKSDVIVSATTAREPVVKGILLKEGARVASIGAPKPVREVDLDTIRRAGCVLADTKDGVLSESGCVEDAVRNRIGFEIVDLRDVIAKGMKCDFREIGFYKSVGTALFDLAMAVHLFKRYRAKSL